MATNVQSQVEVLKASRQAFADGTGKNAQANHQGAALAALSLPINGEVARLGNTFVGGTATAVAPVAAMPTTAAHNPSPTHTSAPFFFMTFLFAMRPAGASEV